ncbi:hypothetical protein AFCA_005841 [Aspergillus flavus]|nr:hypothetical protein AFCA_005841 [Aspergillus flavus]
MDQDKKERLSRLQMEDLGTARREHISTTDSRKVKKARLEDIEATRLSNQPGTEAQRLAEQNRQQLTEWKNVFQKLGDTDDLENLDELLNGQSHRLQLRAALHGSGSYDSGRSLKATDDYPKPSEALLSASTRGSRSRGRGGGIAGTRGRGDIRAVTVSTVNLPRLLSPPECFLEEARKLLQRVSETAPATTQNESNLPSAPSTASPRENRMEQPITTQKALLSNTKAVASHDEPASVTTLTIAPHENPEPQLSAAQVTADRVIKDNLSENAESTIVISKTTRKDQSASESVLKTPEESLLDLSSTPPTKDSFMRDDNLIMSPSLQELEGLEFMQSLTNTPGSTSSPIVQRPECEEPLKSTAFEEKSSATTQADEDGACDKFQRDIEMLCKLMASTSLSDKHRESLEECKAELEAKLQSFHRTPRLTPTHLEPSTKSPTEARSALPVSKSRNSPSLLSRLNGTAAPFIPSRPDMSPTPTRTRARSVSYTVHSCHIFGNHLLPGQRENQAAVQPKETHIFGDHILPGRRQVSESSSTQVKFNIPRKTPALPNLKIPGFGGHEDPVLESSHPLGDTQQTLLHTGPVNKMIRKTGAPDDQLQQSVHAPKENKTPVTRSSGQALGGLQASIYAIREENKPIR